MRRLFRLILATSISSALVGAPALVRAQVPGKPVVVVNVVTGEGEPEVDAVSLRAAIAAELGDDAVAAGDRRAPQAVGTLDVSMDRRARTLAVAYRGQAEPITRTIPLPADRATAERAAVLLAGNLARDEAGELARTLHRSEGGEKHPGATAERLRELDRLGETLAARVGESHKRRTVSRVTLAAALGAFTVSSGFVASWLAKNDDSRLAAAQYAGWAGGAMLVLGAFFAPASFDGLHDHYVSERGSMFLEPEELRVSLEQDWAAEAQKEHRARFNTGLWVTIAAGAALVTSVSAAVDDAVRPNGGANTVGPAIAAAAVAGELAVIGISMLATRGAIESSLRDYDRSSGEVVRLRGSGATISLRPFVAPASGGGTVGLGGEF